MRDESTTAHEIGRLSALVLGLKEKAGEADDRLDRIDGDLRGMREQLGEIAAAIQEQSPRTGELHILGRRWSRTQAAVLAALLAVLTYLAVEMRADHRHYDRFISAGSRATAGHLLPVVDCLIRVSEPGDVGGWCDELGELREELHRSVREAE
jgi:hypothetical protein